MRVNVLKGGKISELKCEVLVVGVFAKANFSSEQSVAEADELTDGAMRRFLAKNKKFGKPFEAVPFQISPKKHKNIEKVILVGLGDFEKLDNYKLRLLAVFAGKNKGKDVKSVALSLPKKVIIEDKIDLLVIGFLDGNFDSGHHKSHKEHHLDFEELVILSDKVSGGIQKKVERALVIADSIHKVREVVNQPSNIATPEYLVSFAKKIAQDNKLKIQVFSEKQVNEMGMGIMASVAKGSELDLYFVVVRYLGAGSSGPTLALVGKGITFDSGGISIKPGEQMDWMKMDMAGAASCFGAMEAISKLKPKVNVVCACPLTENLPSGKASKPGDVVKGLSGKTVEIINTDAEGRLVLSDALTYVQKNFKPDYIVDCATLTGAVIAALGNLATGVMGKPQDFVDLVIKSGEETGERMWQLPLYDEYHELIKSYIADIANLSSGKGGGAETAAKFLEYFIDKKQKWAHLDIASTAWEESDKPYTAKGATGSSVTTLVQLAENLAK